MKKFKLFVWLYITQMMAAAILIYAMDKIFALIGENVYVGINAYTLCFTGFAGIPGVIGLFSLAFILKSA